MKVIKYARWALALVLPLVVSAGNASTSAPSYTASGIGAPSFPFFLDINETINMKRIGSGSNAYWEMKGSGSTTSFWGPDTAYNLGHESVNYQAYFNAAGQLITSIGTKTLSNFLEIRGSLPAGQIGDTSWNAQPNQLLLSAQLLDSNSANNTPDLIGTYEGVALGFKTLFTGGWAANNLGLTGGSIGENFWLFSNSSDFRKLVKALDGFSSNGTLSSLIGSSKTITGVASVASVPVPAAAWLFGTGLMTFFAGRRKSTGSRLAV